MDEASIAACDGRFAQFEKIILEERFDATPDSVDVADRVVGIQYREVIPRASYRRLTELQAPDGRWTGGQVRGLNPSTLMIPVDGPPWIDCDPELWEERRRISVAHELAHALMPLTTKQLYEGWAPRSDETRFTPVQEGLADTFASEFLVPRPIFGHALRHIRLSQLRDIFQMPWGDLQIILIPQIAHPVLVQIIVPRWRRSVVSSFSSPVDFKFGTGCFGDVLSATLPILNADGSCDDASDFIQVVDSTGAKTLAHLSKDQHADILRDLDSYDILQRCEVCMERGIPHVSAARYRFSWGVDLASAQFHIVEAEPRPFREYFIPTTLRGQLKGDEVECVIVASIEDPETHVPPRESGPFTVPWEALNTSIPERLLRNQAGAEVFDVYSWLNSLRRIVRLPPKDYVAAHGPQLDWRLPSFNAHREPAPRPLPPEDFG